MLIYSGMWTNNNQDGFSFEWTANELRKLCTLGASKSVSVLWKYIISANANLHIWSAPHDK